MIKKITFGIDLKAYIARCKDTESLLLTYNLLTTELQKLLFLHIFYSQNSRQSHLENSLYESRLHFEWYAFQVGHDSCSLLAPNFGHCSTRNYSLWLQAKFSRRKKDGNNEASTHILFLIFWWGEDRISIWL